MNINEYQNKCLRTFKQKDEFSENIKQCLLGLSGETGEVVDLFKKHFYQNEICPNEERVIEEIGDVMWYVANLCNSLEIDLSEVLQANIDKLEKRYPTQKIEPKDNFIECSLCGNKYDSSKIVRCPHTHITHSPTNPSHYPNENDPIKYAFDNNLPFAEANVVKYITRHNHKNGIEDLEKAEEYIKRIKKEYYK